MNGLHDLGSRLAAGRRARPISQRELARRVGVSASLISQIENGKVQPSVATLMAIVNELGLSIDETLDPSASASALVGAPTADRPTDSEPSVVRPPHVSSGRRPVVQPGDERAQIELGSGVRWERLTVASDPDVDFILVRYPPGAASSEGDQLLTHRGREYWYIVEGVLSVRLVFDEYHAGPNDSFSFDCTLPHQFRNDGDVAVSAVVTIVRTSPSGH